MEPLSGGASEPLPQQSLADVPFEPAGGMGEENEKGDETVQEETEKNSDQLPENGDETVQEETKKNSDQLPENGDETVQEETEKNSDQLPEEMLPETPEKPQNVQSAMEVEEIPSTTKKTKAELPEPSPQKVPDEEEPPLVTRQDQWEQKPKQKAKPGRKPKAKAKAKAKRSPKHGTKAKKTDPKEVETIDSEEEEQEDKNEEKKVRQGTKRKGARKGAKTPKVKEVNVGDVQNTEDTKNKKKKDDPPIIYKPVSAVGKEDIEAAFQWGPGEEPLGKATFARRPMPKTSPAKERWRAIADSFDYHIAEWLVFYGMPLHSFEAIWSTKPFLNMSLKDIKVLCMRGICNIYIVYK